MLVHLLLQIIPFQNLYQAPARALVLHQAPSLGLAIAHCRKRLRVVASLRRLCLRDRKPPVGANLVNLLKLAVLVLLKLQNTANRAARPILAVLASQLASSLALSVQPVLLWQLLYRYLIENAPSLFIIPATF